MREGRDYEWLIAINAVANGFLPWEEDLSEDSAEDPERIVFLRQLLSQLSDESKTVLVLVWECPREAIDVLYSATGKHGDTTPERVANYLCKHWRWKRAKALKALRELKRLYEKL